MLPWLVLNSGLKGFSHFSLANSWDYSSVPLCMAWCLWIKRSSSFWDRGTYQSFPLQLICFWTLFEFFFNLETMKKNLLQSKRLIVLPLTFKSNQSPSWIFWMTRGTNRVLHLIFLLSLSSTLATLLLPDRYPAPQQCLSTMPSLTYQVPMDVWLCFSFLYSVLWKCFWHKGGEAKGFEAQTITFSVEWVPKQRMKEEDPRRWEMLLQIRKVERERGRRDGTWRLQVFVETGTSQATF